MLSPICHTALNSGQLASAVHAHRVSTLADPAMCTASNCSFSSCKWKATAAECFARALPWTAGGTSLPSDHRGRCMCLSPYLHVNAEGMAFAQQILGKLIWNSKAKLYVL
jgi:hypothetical protein